MCVYVYSPNKIIFGGGKQMAITMNKNTRSWDMAPLFLW